MPNFRESDFAKRLEQQRGKVLSDKERARINREFERVQKANEARQKREELARAEAKTRYDAAYKEVRLRAMRQYDRLVRTKLETLGEVLFGKNPFYGLIGKQHYTVAADAKWPGWELQKFPRIEGTHSSYYQVSPGGKSAPSYELRSSKSFFYMGYKVTLLGHAAGSLESGTAPSFEPYGFQVRGSAGVFECSLSEKELEDALLRCGEPTRL